MIRTITAAALVAGGFATAAAPAQAFTAYDLCQQRLHKAHVGDTRHEVRETLGQRGVRTANTPDAQLRAYRCLGGMSFSVTYDRQGRHLVVVDRELEGNMTR